MGSLHLEHVVNTCLHLFLETKLFSKLFLQNGCTVLHSYQKPRKTPSWCQLFVFHTLKGIQRNLQWWLHEYNWARCLSTYLYAIIHFFGKSSVQSLCLFLFICFTSISLCMHAHVSIKVRGQLSGVGHLFPSLGTRELNVSSALVTSIYRLSHITGSCPCFQIHFTVAFWETLHILDVLFLFFFGSGIWFASVSSQSVACLFILLAQNKRF